MFFVCFFFFFFFCCCFLLLSLFAFLFYLFVWIFCPAKSTTNGHRYCLNISSVVVGGGGGGGGGVGVLVGFFLLGGKYLSAVKIKARSGWHIFRLSCSNDVMPDSWMVGLRSIPLGCLW